MLEIKVHSIAQAPLYKQIVEQIKQQVANSQLRPGEKVPTVRELSARLKINPGTVARAYQELEQAGILGASRRRGTVILGNSDNSPGEILRQNRLDGMVNGCILEVLSQGYGPEELEAAFTLQLARWRTQRETTRASPHIDSDAVTAQTIHVVGSNDLALDFLINRLRYKNPEILVQMTPAGSLGGLLALQEDKADMAGIHLLDEESGQYNYPYVKHILPNSEVAVVHLADRIQGLMILKGNPKNIQSVQDLKRPGIIFVNRQKGSGTRVWLDYKLRELGIQPSTIKGYERELDTHLAVALSIVREEADVALGIQAAANSCNLHFIPVTKERFDLIIPMKNYRSPAFTPLLEIIRSEEFKQVVNNMGGYDTSQTGETVFLK